MTNQKLDQKSLNKLANKMLRQHGFNSDGSKIKSVPTNQRIFDRYMVINTPMGNGTR